MMKFLMIKYKIAKTAKPLRVNLKDKRKILSGKCVVTSESFPFEVFPRIKI